MSQSGPERAATAQEQEIEASGDAAGAAQHEAVAGTVYAPAVSAELDRERNRGQALENSAEAVVRSVATMLALFTAVLALIGGTHLGLAPISLALIAVAYGLLIVSGLAATGVSILGHRLRSSGEISTDVLETWLANWGATDGMAAARDVASLEIGLLKTMRHGNFRKRQLTVMAVGCELGGLAALVVSLASIAVKQLFAT